MNPELGFIEGFFCSSMFSCFKPEVVLVNITYLIGYCDLMLIQPWIKVMYYSLLWLTLHIRAGINISHLSIPGIVVHAKCYTSHCFWYFFSFLLAVVLNCLSCSACILQTRNKPNQFVIQIKVHFFSNLWFCLSLKSILLLLWLSLLIINFFSTCFVCLFFLIFIVQ